MGISAQMINQRTTGYLCDPVCHYVILRGLIFMPVVMDLHINFF